MEIKDMDYPRLRQQLNDSETVFYGPHPCPRCGNSVIRQELAKGGTMYEDLSEGYSVHACSSMDAIAFAQARVVEAKKSDVLELLKKELPYYERDDKDDFFYLARTDDLGRVAHLIAQMIQTWE